MGSAPFTVIARLQPSVSCVRVSGVLRASAGAMAGVAIDVQPLRRYMTQRHRILALATVVTAGLILVICATNLANLLLLRIAHRATELRIRAFMGASQWDVDRLIGMEVAILGAAGAACGLLLTRVALTFVRAVIPAEYAALGEPSVTLRAAVFAGCATLLVATAAGATARAAIRIPLRRVLDRPMSAALPARRTIGFSVAAAQAAFTVVLLVAAALLVRSWVNLRTRDTGFAGNVIVASVSYPAGGFQLQSSMDQTLEAIRRLPAVSAAASAMGAMADRSQWNVVVEVGGEMVPVAGKFVTPGYFDATGSRLLAGRGFSEHDQPNVIVVNETFARRYYPQGAVGRILGRHDVAEVVGVVGDALDQALDADPRPTVFWLLAAPQCSGCNNVLSYVVRPAARPPNLRSLIRGTITRVSPDAIVVEVASMDERLTGSIADRWFATLIVVFFAVAAVTICAGGVFATAASLVARRTREIAVRVALGARPSQVLRLVVRDSLTATAMGVAIGTIAGVWVSQTLRTMLYGVQPGDPVTTALGVLAMFGATAASALVPAARALRLSPTEALREE
jgi:predicted permease